MGQLYDQKGAIELMMKVFETTPEFIQTYGDDESLSTQLTEVYNNIEKTGGPFFKPLTYKNNKDVKIPDIRAEMDKVMIDVLGFYQIRNM